MKTEKKITAAKLIEYAFATPQRRTKIIGNALTPPTYILDTKYPTIERANAHYLATKCTNDSRLNQLDESYKKQPSHSDHQESRLLNALDAIECARNMDWCIPSDVEVKLALDLPDSFELCGINVRVKPSILMKRARYGHKFPEIGVAKSYFSKTTPLQNDSTREKGVLFSTLLHWYCEETLGFIGDAAPRLCMIGDVFDEKVHFAAKRYIQRRKQLEALAEEITDRWLPIKRRLGISYTTKSILDKK